MSQTTLVLDCHYLCHRAFHAQKDLSHDGIATGVIFGFLKSVGHLKNEFQTDKVAFCFEGDTLWRKIWFKGYKQKRVQAEVDPLKIQARGDLCRQIDALRNHHLRDIGFRNIFYYPGYESDDVMAKICQEEDGEVVLVTSDADLYQCIRPNVSIWCPTKQKLHSEKWFRKEYGIPPWKWAIVKAMAGCGTDGVPGIEGVGEITALKYLKGELDPKSKIFKAIKSCTSSEIVQRNRKLVELPLSDPPTPSPEWREEKVSAKGWDAVCRKLGIQSMMGRPPVYSRKYLKDER